MSIALQQVQVCNQKLPVAPQVCMRPTKCMKNIYPNVLVLGTKEWLKRKSITRKFPPLASISKFGSSSIAKLNPKRHDDSKFTNMPPASVMTRLILIMVWRKLTHNPNTYSSLIGLTWSLIAFRWKVEMPAILEQSIRILFDASLVMAMFSLGMFMALQPRIIACGNSIAAFAMAIRFLTGLAVMATASIVVGLRGVFLHVATIQGQSVAGPSSDPPGPFFVPSTSPEFSTGPSNFTTDSEHRHHTSFTQLMMSDTPPHLRQSVDSGVAAVVASSQPLMEGLVTPDRPRAFEVNLQSDYLLALELEKSLNKRSSEHVRRAPSSPLSPST